MKVVATKTAWDLIGFDGTLASYDIDNPLVEEARASGTLGGPAHDSTYSVRVKGGRTLYEAVSNNGGYKVCLARLDTSEGLRAVTRYVDADTELEVVKED
jgi:hypothetical protein